MNNRGPVYFFRRLDITLAIGLSDSMVRVLFSQ